MRIRHQYGRRDSQTPRYDIPVVMHQQWRDGDVEAVKRHFDDPREMLPRHHGHPLCGLGAYNDDEVGYFKMWEELSGMMMDEDGFLVPIITDKDGNRMPMKLTAMIDVITKGNECSTFQPAYRQGIINMMKVWDVIHDEDTFLSLYTPWLFGNDANLRFPLWLKERNLDSIDSKYICASTFGGYAMCMFMRTDILKRYTDFKTRDILRKTYQRDASEFRPNWNNIW